MKNDARSVSWMKSVAKNANIGEVPSVTAKRSGMSHDAARERPSFSINLRMASAPNTSASTPKIRGVHLRRVPSSSAVVLCPKARCRGAAA